MFIYSILTVTSRRRWPHYWRVLKLIAILLNNICCKFLPNISVCT
jgi:hypothetical protein